MGGEAAELVGEPEQGIPADELEVAKFADPALAEAKNYPLVIRAGSSDAPVLVAIDDQGELTYGEGYEPDEAARIFWEAMADGMPDGFKSPPQ